MFCTTYYGQQDIVQGKDSGKSQGGVTTETTHKGIQDDVDVLTSMTPVAESGHRRFVCDDVDNTNGSGGSSCSNGSGNTSARTAVSPSRGEEEVDEVVGVEEDGVGIREVCGDVVCARSAVIETRTRVPQEEEEEENVCSICLDEFTDADPEAETVCGHGYHLQCIMQWAQRSRECPLCFKELAMSDEDMNALLPFGEYVSPRDMESQSSMLATMELERFLVHLAAIEQRRQDRRRTERRGGDSNTRRERRVDGDASSSPGRGDCGHVVAQHHHSSGGDGGEYPPPREDSIVRSASQSLKSVKNKFASLFLFAGNS